MEIAVVISAISITFAILTFAFTRKDKSNDITRDDSYHWGKIDAKLKNIEDFMSKIERKLETYDKEIDERIDLALKYHIKEYHSKQE